MRKGWHIKIAAKCPLGSWVQYDFSQVSEIDMQVYRSLNAPEYLLNLSFSIANGLHVHDKHMRNNHLQQLLHEKCGNPALPIACFVQLPNLTAVSAGLPPSVPGTTRLLIFGISPGEIWKCGCQ